MFSLKASQEVPDWLERAAEEAFGSSYGPSGGKFASRDRRQVGIDIISKPQIAV